MRALRWHGRRDVRLEEVPDAPAPGPGEVRLDVEWCGICGTDVEEYTDGPLLIATEPHPLTGCQAPMVIGHEVCGRISDVGAGVDELAPGDLVAVDGLFHCGECPACSRHEVNLCERWASIGMGYPGGLAERMTVPAYSAIPAHPGADPREVALSEPFAVAVRAVRRGRVTAGERVAVLGGGTIGLAALQVALDAGAERVAVVEPVAWRREKAVELGAAAGVIPGDPVADALGGPPDVVVDCTGSSRTPEAAVKLVRAGGRVVLVGLPPEPGGLDFLHLVVHEVELIGSLSHIYDTDFRAAVELLGRGRAKAAPLVTHELPLEQAVEDGIALLAGPDRGSALKILISPRL